MREKLAVEYTLSTAVLQALNSWIPPQEGLYSILTSRSWAVGLADMLARA
jgi:hypothetical protein